MTEGTTIPAAEMSAHVGQVFADAKSVKSTVSFLDDDYLTLYVDVEHKFGGHGGVRGAGHRGGDEVEFMYRRNALYVKVRPADSLLGDPDPVWFEAGSLDAPADPELDEDATDIGLLLGFDLSGEMLATAGPFTFEGVVEPDGETVRLWRYSSSIPAHVVLSRVPSAVARAVEVAEAPIPVMIFLGADGRPDHVLYLPVEAAPDVVSQFSYHWGSDVQVDAPPIAAVEA